MIFITAQKPIKEGVKTAWNFMAQIFMQDSRSWPDYACRSQNGSAMPIWSVGLTRPVLLKSESLHWRAFRLGWDPPLFNPPGVCTKIEFGSKLSKASLGHAVPVLMGSPIVESK